MWNEEGSSLAGVSEKAWLSGGGGDRVGWEDWKGSEYLES